MTQVHHPREDCRQLFGRLSEYLDGEIDAVACREIRQHIRHCVPCEACFKTLERTVALCRETAPIPVPASLSLKLEEIVRSLAARER
jgi:anti-sigma factor RsiW